jgi:FK506-binding protein 1
MGVEKTLVSQGNGTDTPRKGDTVIMEYTGWLYDTSKPENKGNQSVLDLYEFNNMKLKLA